MTSTMAPTATGVLSRILREGYGTGAWHGPDLKAALADVTPATAFKRPSAGRHNVAEVALHHAFYVRSVIERLTGKAPEPFPVEGDDWFALDGKAGLKWPAVLETLNRYQDALVKVVKDLDAGRLKSPLPENERFDLVLGITCHAVYHAGQIQLVKKMTA